MTAFDQAFAVSKGNMANVDLGHYVAAGGDPIAFIEEVPRADLQRPPEGPDDAGATARRTCRGEPATRR